MAYQCAEDIRRRAEEIRGGHMPSSWARFLGSSPLRWRLVADALEETKQFQPTPTCFHIVSAWYEAFLAAACDAFLAEARRANGGIEPQIADLTRLKSKVDIDILLRGPTIFEVKREFVRLFVPEKERPRDWRSRKALNKFQHCLLPSRQSIVKTLRRLDLRLRRDEVGRPRNSQPK